MFIFYWLLKIKKNEWLKRRVKPYICSIVVCLSLVLKIGSGGLSSASDSHRTLAVGVQSYSVLEYLNRNRVLDRADSPSEYSNIRYNRFTSSL